MGDLIEFKVEFAALIVRVILAILLIAQGYDKLFRIGVERAGNVSAEALHSLHLAKGFIKVVVLMTALIEFFGGLLLLVGFMTIPTCYVIAAGLLPVTIAMSIKEPLWNMQHVCTRLVMIVFLLCLPDHVHVVSLDYLFK